MFTHTEEDFFFQAFRRVFTSAAFISKNRSLVKYFAIPFILNIILLSAVFYLSWSATVPMVKNLLTGGEWYIRMLSMMVKPVISVLLALGTVIIYSAAGGIVTAPFLDLLSEKTERLAGVPEGGEKFSILSMISDIYRALMNSIRLLLIIILINIVLLILFILPGGSFLYSITGFFTSIFFYGFQFYDFPLERMKLPFSEKLGLCWRWRRTVAGTGAAFLVLSFIPVIGFLGLNLATVGATLLFAEKIRANLLTGKN